MPKKFLLKQGALLMALLYCACGNSTGPTYKAPYIPELVKIDNDLTFTMGCQDSLGFICVHRDVIPPFKAILSPYYIGKYEVRNDEFIHFVDNGGYCDSTLWSEAGWNYIKSGNRDRPVDWIDGLKPWINCPLSNTPAHPINNISWYEGEAYCEWLSQKTGEKYALPTEAQWERAVRGPDPGRIFSWGNVHDPDKYNNLMYSKKLYPVGSFKEDKSYDSCYDMTGNLLEFCSDWYAIEIYQTYKENEPVLNPAGPDSNITGQRSLRGSFNFFHYDWEIEYQIQTVTRMKCMPGDSSPIYGFRVVKNIN